MGFICSSDGGGKEEEEEEEEGKKLLNGGGGTGRERLNFLFLSWLGREGVFGGFFLGGEAVVTWFRMPSQNGFSTTTAQKK